MRLTTFCINGEGRCAPRGLYTKPHPPSPAFLVSRICAYKPPLILHSQVPSSNYPPLSIYKVVSHVSSRRLGTHPCCLEFQSAKPNPVFGPRTLGGFGNCFSSLGHATGSPGPAIRSPFLIPSLSR